MSDEVSLSAVAQHTVDEMHWLGATVVDSHPQFLQRCALEARHICSEDNTMTRYAGPFYLQSTTLSSTGVTSNIARHYSLFLTSSALPYLVCLLF